MNWRRGLVREGAKLAAGLLLSALISLPALHSMAVVSRTAVKWFQVPVLRLTPMSWK